MVLGDSGAGPNPRPGGSTGLCQLTGWLLPAHYHAGHLDGRQPGAGTLHPFEQDGPQIVQVCIVALESGPELMPYTFFSAKIACKMHGSY